MTQDRITHLTFIQTIIDRMNRNSFQLKGWAITVLSAFLALYASSNNKLFILVAIVPVFMFWGLDAYYLQQERKFRAIYSAIVNDDKRVRLFSMPINLFSEGNCRYCSSFFSKTIVVFYGIVISFLIVGVALLPPNAVSFQAAKDSVCGTTPTEAKKDDVIMFKAHLLTRDVMHTNRYETAKQ